MTVQTLTLCTQQPYGASLRKNSIRLFFFVPLLLAACTGPGGDRTKETPSAKNQPAVAGGIVRGKLIDSGFPPGDSQYHTMIHASDGNIYYAIGTHERNTHVRMFRYNPANATATEIADIGKVLVEDGSKAIPQGKIHSDFFELDGALYFATHVGFFRRGGTEDHSPYPGGHFMSYRLADGIFTDYGIGAPEEGIVTMNMDLKRRRMYCFTVPSGIFLYYDLVSGRKRLFPPAKFSNEPRSLGIDPRDGDVYWCRNDSVYCYNYDRDLIEAMPHTFDRPILKIAARGKPAEVTWRSVRWNERFQRFFGVTFIGEYLFSYEPQSGDIEILDRLAAGPNRASGELAPVSSLAFELSQDGSTIYYIAGVKTGQAGRKADLHLLTYDLCVKRLTDHGVIELEDGRRPYYCQSMEVGRDGNLYLGCEILVTNRTSEKWRRIFEAKKTYLPAEELEKELDENNLVVVRDPLATN